MVPSSFLLLLAITTLCAVASALPGAENEPTSYELAQRHAEQMSPYERERMRARRIAQEARTRRVDHRDDSDDNFEGAHRRKLQTTSSLSTGVSAPPLQSGPSMASVNMTYFRWESVSLPLKDGIPTVDWRTTAAITPVLEQFLCSSCWSIAAVDSIAMMWAIAVNTIATPLSPQQVCDCATKQCCQSGWPDWAFSYVLYNGGIASLDDYPYVAADFATCFLNSSAMPTIAQITGWELVPANNPIALMKAVSMQPVVAFMDASNRDFALYQSRGTVNIFNGNCSTEINHAVVVVGYRYNASNLAASYWIVKNSWYRSWGDGGYMYLAMNGDTRGKCGMHSTPAMYPVYYPSGPQPARFSSDQKGKWRINKVDDLTCTFTNYTLSSSAVSTFTSQTTTAADACIGIVNPCGAGRCYSLVGVARCDCSLLVDMVEVVGMPTSKCVPRYPCALSAVNQCVGGSCMDTGDGTYTCSCRAGYALGASVDGTPACLPYAGVFKTYTTIPGESCTTVSAANNITTATLTSLNIFLNCTDTQYIPPGVVLTVSTSTLASSPTINSTICTSSYTVRGKDSCASIAADFFGRSLDALLAMNPGINCNRLFRSQQICIKQSTVSAATSAPLCGQAVDSVAGDTCALLAVKYNIASSYMATLNPALNCNVALPIGVSVCVSNKTAQMTSDISCTSWYRVMFGDTCPIIWNSANLTMSQFLAINPGLQCQAPFLSVGQQVCISAPILATMKTVSVTYYRYTVQKQDTLSYVSSLYIRKCTSTSVSTQSIAAQNNIAPTASLSVGTNLTIPCVGRAGVIDCGCSASLPVCGADFVTYPSECDAWCNYALPAFADNAPCSGCTVACEGRTGLAPLSGYGCSWSMCPYPTWWNSGSTDTALCANMIQDPYGNCCLYMNQTCSNACTATSMTLGGTTTQRNTNYNNCFNQCMCSYRIPCGARNCTAPSSCWNQSPRRCEYSTSTFKYSYTVPLNPAESPLP